MEVNLGIPLKETTRDGLQGSFSHSLPIAPVRQHIPIEFQVFDEGRLSQEQREELLGVALDGWG